MSAGLDALERRDYSAARQAFQAAGQARPDSPEVAEALLQTRYGVEIIAWVESVGSVTAGSVDPLQVTREDVDRFEWRGDKVCSAEF